MPEWVQEKVHNEIQRLITLLSMKTCTYNFDMRIDKDYNVYLMEVAPRDGGNYIPQLIKYATGVDLVECSIKAALGEPIKISAMKPQGFWSYFAVHSLKNGILSKISIDATFAKEHIVENHVTKRTGDEIKSFTGANTTLGCLLLKFNSMEEMLWAMDNSEEWIQVIVE
jgi:biotin carboxylase